MQVKRESQKEMRSAVDVRSGGENCSKQISPSTSLTKSAIDLAEIIHNSFIFKD